MQTTLTSTLIEQPNYELMIHELDKFSQHWNKVKRYLYKDIISLYKLHNTNILTSTQHNELKSTYQVKFNINARHFNSIFIELMGNINSVLKLNQSYIEDTKAKVIYLNKIITSKQTTLDKLINKIISSDYHSKFSLSVQKVEQVNLKSLKSKLYHLKISLIKANHKLLKLNSIKNTGNPRLCFGSKKLFRQQFQINKENNLTQFKHKTQWDKLWFQSRNKSFIMVGTSTESVGNSNCQLRVIDSEHTSNNIFELKINLYKDAQSIKDRYLTIKIKVHNDVKHYLTNIINSKQPIKQALTYRFYRNYKKSNKDGVFNDYKIFISLDKVKQAPKEISCKLLGTVGIDINANHISMTEVDRHGNILLTKDYDLNLKDKSTQQRTNNIALAIKAITNHAVKVSKPVVIEKLNFSQKKLELKSGVNKKYNVMLSSFSYSKIIELCKSRCFDKGLEVIEVNPAYTSKIGKFKYQNLYKLTTHQAASLVISRRGLFSYEKTVKKEIKQKETNEVIIVDKVITVIHKEKTISNRRSKYYLFQLPARNIKRTNNNYWKEVELDYNTAKKNRLLLKSKNLIPSKPDLLGEAPLVAYNLREPTVALDPDLLSPF